MASDEEFRETRDNVTSALVDTTKTVASIAAEDLTFQRSLNPAIVETLAAQQARLLDLSQSLLNAATAQIKAKTPQLKGVESIDNEWNRLVDVFDTLLERADATLDEYTGIIKKPDPLHEAPSNVRDTKERFFQRPPNNVDESPFKPLLRNKPHALKPLEESLVIVSSEDGKETYQHPYQVEIDAYTYPIQMYSSTEPKAYLPFSTASAIFVDTLEAVDSMLEELQLANEIAVDLEHHDTYSYLGIVSLMQISTREKDWIIDTLKPWREELHVLNKVFADPGILKVFHGSTMDMIWLQRDLGLYVVGLFDTFHACRVLQHPKKSLKALLEKYANFDAQKKYQMADWRTRPLPSGMLDYARSDTHFLLYIYDNLRNELDQMSASMKTEIHLLQEVLSSSKAESLQTYLRPVYDMEHGTGVGGWANSLRSAPALFSGEQFAVYKAIHRWRDQQARGVDVNPVVIMGRDVMFSIARTMPDNFHALLGCHQRFPTSLRPRTSELLALIKESMKEGRHQPSLQEYYDSRELSRGQASFPELKPSTPSANVSTQAFAKQSESDISSIPIARQSALWGNIISRTFCSKSMIVPRTKSNHTLLIPVPSSKVFEEASTSLVDEGDIKTQDRLEKMLTPPTDDYQIPGNDMVFVAKELGGPKKRKFDRTQSNGDNVLLEAMSGYDNGSRPKTNGVLRSSQYRIDEASGKQSREALGQQRKSRKAEKRHAAVQMREAAEEDTPFDYAKAPSMLRGDTTSTPLRDQKRPIDPYAKSLNAPPGARKVQREKPGKSFTFKD